MQCELIQKYPFCCSWMVHYIALVCELWADIKANKIFNKVIAVNTQCFMLFCIILAYTCNKKFLCLTVTVKATSKGRCKRKRTEGEHESSSTTGGQKPGKKSRRRVQGQGQSQGQAEKVNKKNKTRKSQLERRNIRWCKHHNGCHSIMIDCCSFDRVMLTNVPYLISRNNLLYADIFPVLEVVWWHSDRASDLGFHWHDLTPSQSAAT